MQDIVAYFSKNGEPVKGLTPIIRIREIITSGSPDSNIVINNQSMQEIGDGYYVYQFIEYDPRIDYAFIADGGTSLTTGDRYAVGVTEVPDPEENADAVWVASEASDLIALVEEIIKYSKNRTYLDKQAKTLTVFHDDGITPLRVFSLRDASGTPSITEIVERLPQ